MRLHRKTAQPNQPVTTLKPAAPPPAPAATTTETTTAKGDEYLDPQKRQALMDNVLRAQQQGGARPFIPMGVPAGVRAFADAQHTSPAPGVDHALISQDAAATLSRTDLSAGSATKAGRSDTDQRVLVSGTGTVSLNGVDQPLVPGDMVLIPRGTKFAFSADRGEPMQLYTVASNAAPMQNSPGVLSEDPKKEFFVGEGVLILERANSALDPSVGFDRCRVPAGITTATHKLKIDERYLITRGEGEMELDGQKLHVKAGDVVNIPKGAAQRITAAAGGIDFYSVTTPRFLVEDYDQHLTDAVVNPALYDGLAGPLAAVQAKIHQP